MGIADDLLAEIASSLVEDGPVLGPKGAPGEITTAWVKGIRASWKKLVDKVKKLSKPEAKAIDFALIPQAAKPRLEALDDLLSYVKALRADLAINKAMWSASSVADAKETGSKAQVLRAQVMTGLDKAEDLIGEAQSRIRYWVNVVDTTSHEYQLGPSHRTSAETSIDAFQRLLNGVHFSAIEGATSADDEISRGVLKTLSSGIMKIEPFPGKKTEVPLDFGSYLPDVVREGDVTLMFGDTPSAGDSVSRPSARMRLNQFGFSDVKAEPRSPVFRKAYLQQMKEARALLTRRGLGHLWYGRIVVMCRDCGGENPHGKEFGTGAHYHRKGDWISVYSEPSRSLSTLVAHEMGHRYYYKFMSASDRAAFDQWFGTVKPVSTYGGKATEEDFAEVFAHYIDGKDLDRDQLQRFKTFLGKKRKLEHVQRPSDVIALQLRS